MATELPMPETADARREAMLSLHRALLELEAGDSTSARNHCLAALAWIRDV
jgi:hypothetical protein